MSEFKIGDVVQLKSGGPKMTVTKVSAEGYLCRWFQQDHFTGHKFIGATLSRQEEPSSVKATRSGSGS
jgi:uncharacterized protein YodC (DUF2158 family)